MNSFFNKYTIVSLLATVCISSQTLYSVSNNHIHTSRSSLFAEMQTLMQEFQEKIEKEFASTLITSNGKDLENISMNIEEKDSTISIQLTNIKLEDIDSLEIKESTGADKNTYGNYKTIHIPLKDGKATLTIFAHKVVLSTQINKKDDDNNSESPIYYFNQASITKTIPTRVDLTKPIEAEYKNGTLKITLQKSEEIKSHKIMIKK